MTFDVINTLIDTIWTPVTKDLLIASFLGAVLGFERELAGKDPGLRTFTLISLGSCVFSLISISSADGIPYAEPSRIAAQIIPGIGFLGAGAIFRSHARVSGLTTAAMMWIAAAIGMSVGFNRAELATAATFLAIIIIYFLKLGHVLVDRIRRVSNSSTDQLPD